MTAGLPLMGGKPFVLYLIDMLWTSALTFCGKLGSNSTLVFPQLLIYRGINRLVFLSMKFVRRLPLPVMISVLNFMPWAKAIELGICFVSKTIFIMYTVSIGIDDI